MLFNGSLTLSVPYIFVHSTSTEPLHSQPHLWGQTLYGALVLFVVVWLLSLVRPFATPWTVAHRAPLSMGFPRQEYCEREAKVKVAQSCPTLCNLMDCIPWNSPGQKAGVGSQSPSPGDLPNPGIEPRSPTWQADSLPTKPEGKPKNTGVGSLYLLQ